MRGCVILYDDFHHLDDLFHYNLLFRKLRFGGSGTLDLVLGTFGTFYLLGHSPIPDCYF